MSTGAAVATVTFYSEAQLRVQSTAPSEGAPRLVGELVAAGSLQGREHVMRRALADSGFDWLAYGTVARHGTTREPRSFFTSYAHPEWTKLYFQHRYHEVDQRHQTASLTALPLIWDLNDIDAWQASATEGSREWKFAEDFKRSGIRSGVFFQLPSPATTNELAVISLSSTQADRDWIDNTVLGQALTLGLCLHEFLVLHVEGNDFNGAPRSELSNMQRDILECLSKGLSDKEIAYQLKLSSHAVDYHMRQLRRRFSVRNRVQLVNAATS